MRTVLVLLLVAVIALGGVGLYAKYNTQGAKTVFRTAPIERGDVVPTISATGTLEPEDLIDVGSQITGKVLYFGPDPDRPGKTVDFNSAVHKDMLLAKIDPTFYQAQVDQAQAALMKAEAELEQMKATCEQAKNEWERAKELQPMKAIAGTDYDAAVANYLVAKANIAVGKASVQQAKAALQMAQINLNYTDIISPTEGVVVARRVNVGQTVSASLNTPSMFLIAKDLRRMEVWVSVNEADIGRIRDGMPVRFTIDTFPGEKFHGTVTQIRLNAQMTQNVVTYMVIVTTDNSGLKLKPYMTANVSFEVDRRSGVFMVPNEAFKWKPQKSQIAPDALTELSRSSSAKKENGKPLAAEKPSKETAPTSPANGKGELHRLWVIDGDSVRPLDVTVGITDGKNTEISGDGVKEGTQVVIGEEQAEEVAEADDTSNPFIPKIRRGRKPSSSEK